MREKDLKKSLRLSTQLRELQKKKKKKKRKKKKKKKKKKPEQLQA